MISLEDSSEIYKCHRSGTSFALFAENTQGGGKCAKSSRLGLSPLSCAHARQHPQLPSLHMLTSRFPGYRGALGTRRSGLAPLWLFTAHFSILTVLYNIRGCHSSTAVDGPAGEPRHDDRARPSNFPSRRGTALAAS